MIYFFIGTTAELIKLFPIMVEMKEKSIEYEIISSGQNDISNSDIFNKFGLKYPHLVLSDTSHQKTALGLFSWFTKTLLRGRALIKQTLPNVKGSMLIVHGDTVSTVLGGLLGKLLGMKICHVEAGLRSYNFLNPFPEELDRVITSRLASVHFAPNSWATDNLKSKNGLVVNTGENTLLDSLRLSKYVENDISYVSEGKPYFVFVIHRQENLFDTDFVKFMISRCVNESTKTHCVLVLHDLTKIKLEELGFLQELKDNENVTLIPRLEYVDFMGVLSACEYLVTDGGSNQEEAYYMGKPCLILRTHTERVEGLEENVLLSKKSKDLIEKFFDDPYRYKTASKLEDKYPSKVIVEKLIELEGE
ncbi:UDP-N-acetylglucosamine 2-epimerase [Vibrio splendidus]|uniref:UDP-N-acetylglucosamine 2-epimerase n=1 Tax=Vibrio splendidus TaxID=29497 RepID=UPI000C84DF00|nr:UDP-N-acetylglucosamine 2-epimerase [Vibrio splendidus]PMI50806.1 UDP-N-acetylglucosamine 2-epimerase [Vibrio splendidus]